MADNTHIYEGILNQVQKPTRYIGGEWNIVVKPHSDRRVTRRVALAFPDVYEIGMSHLGLRLLYSLLNQRQDLAAERVFCPWIDMEEKLREHGLPLVSLETQTPLSEFEVVGFSLQYELEYTNVLTMLDLGAIPLRSRERTLDDPLVVGGGPCAFSPEPVAEFFDCFLVGDGEEAFPKLIDRYHELRHSGLSREDVLAELAQMEGVYVPSLYATRIDPETGFEVVSGSERAPFPVLRTFVKDINQYPFPADVLVPNGEIVHDRVSIEIARGCTEGCRFCQAGTIYRPVRERSPEQIIHTIMKSLDETGFDEVSLTSLSTADFSCISPLLQRLNEELERKRTSMAVSSLRAYGLTDSMTAELSKVRKGGFTIAPEAGSQRMRDVINKGITEEVILQGASNAFRQGWSHIKLYFMIGLPTETEEDLIAIVELGEKILQLAEKEHGRRAAVTISVSSHIPKPHAPFQWLGLEEIESLQAKQRFLAERIRRRHGLRLKWHNVHVTWLEAIFSRGDRRLSDVLEAAWRRGCRYDAWDDQLKLDIWREVFEDLGVDPGLWLKDIPLYAALPWDHIDSRVKKEFLIRELKRALKGRFTPACEKPYKKRSDFERTDLGKPREDDRLVCYHCGLECDLDAIREERIASWRSLENGVPVQIRDLKGEPIDVVAMRDTRYRATYQKLGEFRFLSALDLTRTFSRAFARSGVPLKYSQGYRPAPLISFGPALGVGMESVQEYLEFETTVEVGPEKLMARINENLPEGLKFTSLRIVQGRTRSLFEQVVASEYSVRLDDPAVTAAVRQRLNGEAHLVAEDLAAAHRALIDSVLRRPSIVIDKVTKGKLRKRDIRPLLERLEVVNGPEPLSLHMRLAMTKQGSVRPEEVLRVLYGDVPWDVFRIRRERLVLEGEE